MLGSVDIVGDNLDWAFTWKAKGGIKFESRFELEVVSIFRLLATLAEAQGVVRHALVRFVVGAAHSRGVAMDVKALAAVLAVAAKVGESATNGAGVANVEPSALHVGTREKTFPVKEECAVGVFLAASKEISLGFSFAASSAPAAAGGVRGVALTFGGGVRVGVITFELAKGEARAERAGTRLIGQLEARLCFG